MADLTPPKACVLIPAYNEEKNIGRVVHAVKDLGFPVLVVDDGSKDGTAEAARAAGAEVLTPGKNQGKGTSLRLGTEWFLKRGNPVLVMMDADGQHDAADLGLFLAALQDGADLAVGDRMHKPERMPLVRVLTNRLMSWVISLIARQRVPDSQCGYRAIRREVLQKISLKTARFEIETEIILEAARAGFRIASVPIRSVYAGEESQIHPVRDTLRFVNFLAAYLISKK